MTSGEIHLAARTARVIVDHVENSFAFELHGAVITRVPERPGTDPEDERESSTLLTVNRHLLGPAPFGEDIRPDPPDAVFDETGGGPALVDASGE